MDMLEQLVKIAYRNSTKSYYTSNNHAFTSSINYDE